MSRIILLTGILWLFSQSIHAEQSQITSPDGKLSVHITDENGVPSYSVSYNHIPFILASPLWLEYKLSDEFYPGNETVYHQSGPTIE